MQTRWCGTTLSKRLCQRGAPYPQPIVALASSRIFFSTSTESAQSLFDEVSAEASDKSVRAEDDQALMQWWNRGPLAAACRGASAHQFLDQVRLRRGCASQITTLEVPAYARTHNHPLRLAMSYTSRKTTRPPPTLPQPCCHRSSVLISTRPQRWGGWGAALN